MAVTLALPQGSASAQNPAYRWVSHFFFQRFVPQWADSVLLVLYLSGPMVYAASRLSSVAALGRLLSLYAASLSTPSARSF